MEGGGIAADTECIKGGNTSCRTLITAFSNSPKAMTPEPRYGFMYLKRASPSDAYVIHCFTDSLYDNMISCVQAATSYSMDTTDSDCKMKIAYFKILNNSAIVRELHNPSVYRQVFDCTA
ncbi:uncharacterized protein TNCT_512001 [Trichonephila clavata]|uniref:Uncharacterized protein n=1 Tax=Trichonephila clavata TaxID=2740835 RepID=A0A8X6GBY4_TRICU|nr:uncharacterized protein TNCT_512001 [Trichonephila clavata]